MTGDAAIGIAQIGVAGMPTLHKKLKTMQGVFALLRR
jgi:hypothetical protein